MGYMAEKKQKTLVLLDVHAIIHRAFHAVPPLVSSTGIPTGALYGLLNMFLKMLQETSPDYIVACYDLPQPTFRHESYEGYKKGRKQTEDTLKVQIDESKNIFHALNIPIYEMPGFEADDILGTISEQVFQSFPDINIVIVSGDMDTLQLVKGERVQVYTLKKGIHDTIFYTESTVKERYQFGPEFIPDYKGLRGDPSDNIIGVPGIGEKTATDLITQFGTIEDIYKKLHDNQQQFLNKKIKQRIIDILLENEAEAFFSKTLATIRLDAPIDFVLPDTTFQDGYTPEKIVRLIQEYEFRSLVNKFQNLVAGKNNDDQNNGEQEKSNEIISENKSDFMKTSVGLWVLNSDMTKPTLAEILQETESETLQQADKKIQKKLQEKNLLSVYQSIEEPLIPIIEQMSEKGVLLDVKFLQDLAKKYREQLEIKEKEIFSITQKEFNINSPKQLSEILFTDLGLKPKGKKGKTGSYSTRSEVLDELVSEHKIIPLIIDYRELQKLLSTYIDVLPTLVDDQNRLHAQFLQHGTTTGRFSSQNPNLQNIPIRSELGRAIRTAFIAPKGSLLVSADYSQIELRILAILSGDPILADVFKNNKDIHTTVASRVFHTSESEVTGNQRRDAKVINFGIIYGMGISALQKNLGTTRAEAESFYEAYFTEFPAIKEYLDGVKSSAKETLQTQTLFGRVRNFPMFRSKLPYMIALAERTAVNAPIQGTAADIIKLAMIDVQEQIKKHVWDEKIFPVLQIHDELIYEVPEKLVKDFSEVLEKTMEQVIEKHSDLIIQDFLKKDIPLKVSVETGNHLGKMH